MLHIISGLVFYKTKVVEESIEMIEPMQLTMIICNFGLT